MPSGLLANTVGPMKSARCTSRELLAGEDAVRVERCSCGTIHVGVGATTLHLSEDGLRLLSSILADATDVLDERDRAIDSLFGLGPTPDPLT